MSLKGLLFVIQLGHVCAFCLVHSLQSMGMAWRQVRMEFSLNAFISMLCKEAVCSHITQCLHFLHHTPLHF